jgi:hypothetical protein
MGLNEDYCSYICRTLFHEHMLRHRHSGFIVLTPRGRWQLPPEERTAPRPKTVRRRVVAQKRRTIDPQGHPSGRGPAATDTRTREHSVPPEIDRTIIQHVADKLSSAVQSAIRHRLRPSFLSMPDSELLEINTSFAASDETKDLQTNLDQPKEERCSAHGLGKIVKMLQALTNK